MKQLSLTSKWYCDSGGPKMSEIKKIYSLLLLVFNIFLEVLCAAIS